MASMQTDHGHPAVRTATLDRNGIHRNLTGIFARKQRGRVFDRIGDGFAEHRQVIVLLGIITLAILFRFWQLSVLPPGLHPDEAAIGLTAINITEGESGPIYEREYPRSGPYLYLTGISMAVFGNTVLGLRLIPAGLGVMAVILTYIAARSWFSKRVAIIAAFFMATSSWLVQINRLVEVSNILLVLIPLNMWLFSRALTTNNARWYVLSGVAFGSLFYTDTALYVPILLAIILVSFARKRYRDYLQRMFQPFLIVLLSAIITIVPIVIYFVANREAFVSEAVPTRIELAEAGTELPALFISTIRTAAMFHFAGDESQLHGLAGEPVLNGLVGVLFVLGAVLALRRFKDIRYFALLGIVLVWLLPNIFDTTAGPNATAILGAAPPIFILAAIGLIELFTRWRGVFPRNILALQFASLAIVVAVAGAVWYDWQRYFVAWANAPETFEAHHEHLYATGEYLGQTGTEQTVYVIVGSNLAQPIEYLAFGQTEYTIIEPETADGLALPSGQGIQIVVPRLGDASELSLQQYAREDIYSQARPGTILYTIYRPH